MPPSSLAMAGAHYTTISFLIPFATATPIRRKRVLLLSSLSTPSSSRLTKRKNYLRPKLLKTLTKPYPNPLHPQSPTTNPVIPIESPLEQYPELPSHQFSCEASPSVVGEEIKELNRQEVRLSESSGSAGVFDASAGKFTTWSVLKFGLWLIGAFVFQTICVVWVLGSADFDHKDGNFDNEDKSRVLELGMNENGKAKSKKLLNRSQRSFGPKIGIGNGGMVHVDESELEEKIDEIRVMARDARERERLEQKTNGLDEDDDDVDEALKSAIGKEVENRLIKLRKRLKNTREKLRVSSVSYLSKNGNVEDGIDKDGLNAKERNGTLMFEKKYRFRSPSIEPSDKPKGFQGSEYGGVSRIENTHSTKVDEMLGIGNVDAVDLLDNEQQLDLLDDNLQGSVLISPQEDGGKKLPTEETKSRQTARKKLGKGRKQGGGQKSRRKTKLAKEIREEKTEQNTGNRQEDNYGRPMVKAMQATEPSKPAAQNSQNLTKEKLNPTEVSKTHDVLSGNGSLKSREVGNKRKSTVVGNKESDTAADVWWLSLSYVLAIGMRRGRDGERPEGLFTVKNPDDAESDSSYTVAFEDRGDATNFCYLLQSFFEDLEDFDADIVPLSIQELEEAVKSHSMKVIVVKKGQLRLYAGQPLGDVEMALRSLVGRS